MTKFVLIFLWVKVNSFYLIILLALFKGWSINDVTDLGGGGQTFCDNSTRALVIKRVTMEEGVKICPKLRDVIYDPFVQVFSLK